MWTCFTQMTGFFPQRHKKHKDKAANASYSFPKWVFQTDRICRQQFWTWWKWRKVSRKKLWKRRNWWWKAVFLSPQCFQRDLFCRHIKICVSRRVNSLPNNKNFDSSKLKNFANDKVVANRNLLLAFMFYHVIVYKFGQGHRESIFTDPERGGFYGENACNQHSLLLKRICSIYAILKLLSAVTFNCVDL